MTNHKISQSVFFISQSFRSIPLSQFRWSHKKFHEIKNVWQHFVSNIKLMLNCQTNSFMNFKSHISIPKTNIKSVKSILCELNYESANPGRSPLSLGLQLEGFSILHIIQQSSNNHPTIIQRSSNDHPTIIKWSSQIPICKVFFLLKLRTQCHFHNCPFRLIANVDTFCCKIYSWSRVTKQSKVFISLIKNQRKVS